MKPELKPKFEERMRRLLPSQEDFQKYNEIIHIPPRNFLRCNTLKMPVETLVKRLKEKWNVVQPYENNPEIILIEQMLKPGELGNAIEHILGYYYIQEVCSMTSVIALDPKPEDLVLDLCASPGSKTTQIASKMENKGTLIANDFKLDRISILSANLERCGVTNAVITRNDAVQLSEKFAKNNFKFDKILLDAPCSGEGTLRSSSKTFLMWNDKVVKNFSRMQKKLLASALKCLKAGGTIVYSTCTHGPEEDESVIDFALKNFPVRIEKIEIPLKYRQGITKWGNDEYDKEVEKCARIYPHDNDSEGFFLAKMTLLEEVE